MLVSSFEPIEMFDSILLPGNYLIKNVKYKIQKNLFTKYRFIKEINRLLGIF